MNKQHVRVLYKLYIYVYLINSKFIDYLRFIKDSTIPSCKPNFPVSRGMIKSNPIVASIKDTTVIIA